jgi:hypothetical protein
VRENNSVVQAHQACKSGVFVGCEVLRLRPHPVEDLVQALVEKKGRKIQLTTKLIGSISDNV